MTITVGGTSITFNDATTQSTAAASPTTANVLAATAGASVGAVGTYAFLVFPGVTYTNFVAGSTYAGSTLAYSGYISPDSTTGGLFGGGTGATVSGTWRAMGSSTISSNSYRRATLFLRIS